MDDTRDVIEAAAKANGREANKAKIAEAISELREENKVRK